MAESTHVERLNAEFRAHHPWRRSATAVAVVLLALASVAGAATGEVSDERLSTTLLGRLVPGGEPRLAVRWDGPPGALLDVWVDLDGDDAASTDELVVEGKPLEPGIEVVGLEIAGEAYVADEPRLWVQVRDNHPAQSDDAAARNRGTETGQGCAWQPGFSIGGLDHYVFATAVYDDGTGPALYVGGLFTAADGEVVNHVAKWDGISWSALSGLSGIGTSGSVEAFTVFDDGTGPALYAGGNFTTAGGQTVNDIAKWDGNDWFALSGSSGTGVNDSVSTLVVFDDGSGPALYAGGRFTAAGGVPASFIAKWDGSEWSALTNPSGMDGRVSALAVFDDGSGPALFAGGLFSTAGGVTVNRIAKWDGSAWSALSGPAGTGVDEWVFALAVFDDGSGPALYAGGDFVSAGGVTVNHVGKWDGTGWSALSGPSGVGMSSIVYALAVLDRGSGPQLCAGGWFATAGGVEVNHIASWDGTSWSALTGPSGTGTSRVVETLAVFDDGSGPALYAGGSFTTAGGVAANRIAKWDGSAWSSLDGPSGMGVNGEIWAFAVFDDGSGPALYAGGGLTTAGEVSVNYIAKWDGTEWSTLSGPSGTGMNGSVDALAVFDDGSGPALYAGGWFTTAGGVTVDYIAKWDGIAWSALTGPTGTGTNGWVEALAVFDDGSGPALFAGGFFTTAGGVTASRIAKWDGSAWSALSGPSGNGMDDAVRSLAVYDDGAGPALFAGGDFVNAGGVTVNHAAKWDGTGWVTLSGPSGTGVSHRVYALAVFDDGSGPALYAGGAFATAGGVTANRIAKWNGARWSALSGPSGTGVDSSVYALVAFDDGSGPALYAGGFFFTAGGMTVNRIARWDGTGWSALTGPIGTGMNLFIEALAVFDDRSGPALYAGGWFGTAGGLPSSRIAAWQCEAAPLFTDGFESGDTSEWSLAIP